jgi:hypothetical protein
MRRREFIALAGDVRGWLVNRGVYAATGDARDWLPAFRASCVLLTQSGHERLE